MLFDLAFEDERYGRSRFVGPDLLSFGREEGGAFSGPGATLMMNSIRRLVPMSRLALPQNTGMTARRDTPIFRPERMSSCVSVPFSK